MATDGCVEGVQAASIEEERLIRAGLARRLDELEDVLRQMLEIQHRLANEVQGLVFRDSASEGAFEQHFSRMREELELCRRRLVKGLKGRAQALPWRPALRAQVGRWEEEPGLPAELLLVDGEPGWRALLAEIGAALGEGWRVRIDEERERGLLCFHFFGALAEGGRPFWEALPRTHAWVRMSGGRLERSPDGVLLCLCVALSEGPAPHDGETR